MTNLIYYFNITLTITHLLVPATVKNPLHNFSLSPIPVFPYDHP